MRRPASALFAFSVGAALLVACSEETAISTADAPSGPPTATEPTPVVDASPPLVDADADAPETAPAPCPEGMQLINAFCIDRYEAYVVEVLANGREAPHSPYDQVEGLNVRAKVGPNVVPQAYISQVQAAKACANAGKRLCARSEFELACRGASTDDWYPYGGQTKVKSACNEGKGSSVSRFFGNDPSKWTYAQFNDPRLNQWEGGLAKTGEYTKCVSPSGVYDLVGNLHEWGDDPADARGRGRFRGGFYGDAEYNGHGCRYVTSAHELSYHDYSTGFRCCVDSD